MSSSIFVVMLAFVVTGDTSPVNNRNEENNILSNPEATPLSVISADKGHAMEFAILKNHSSCVPHPEQDGMPSEHRTQSGHCKWTYSWSNEDQNRLPHKLSVASCNSEKRSLTRCETVHYQIPVLRLNTESQHWVQVWEKVAVACKLVTLHQRASSDKKPLKPTID